MWYTSRRHANRCLIAAIARTGLHLQARRVPDGRGGSQFQHCPKRRRASRVQDQGHPLGNLPTQGLVEIMLRARQTPPAGSHAGSSCETFAR